MRFGYFDTRGPQRTRAGEGGTASRSVPGISWPSTLGRELSLRSSSIGSRPIWPGGDHRCELAFWHHPRFTSGTEHGPDSDPTIEALWGVLHAAGADLIVNAHEHNYERFAPLDADGRPDPTSGIRQFVVGTGGRSLYPFGPPATGSESRISDAFGVLELTLQPTGYRWRFVDVDGKVFWTRAAAAATTEPVASFVHDDRYALDRVVDVAAEVPFGLHRLGGPGPVGGPTTELVFARAPPPT